MLGRQQRALTAGQKDDAGQGRGDGIEQATYSHVGNLLHAGLDGTLLAGDDHVDLQYGVLQAHALLVQFIEHRLQGMQGDVVTAFYGVIGVHQYFGFHHGHDTRFLTQRGVARQGMGVGFYAGAAGDAVTDGDHGAPLGEAGVEFAVFGKAGAQPVQTLGDFFTRVSGHVLGAGVHLDAGHNALVMQGLGKRYPGGRGLAQGLVEQDHAADVLGAAGRGDQQFPVGAAVFLGGLYAYAIEALLDGGKTLVYGEYALALCHHGGCGLFHLCLQIAHLSSPFTAVKRLSFGPIIMSVPACAQPGLSSGCWCRRAAP